MKFDLTYKNVEVSNFGSIRNGDEVICLENHFYKKIFGKTFNEKGCKHRKKAIVKITFSSAKGGKRNIYRMFIGGNSKGIAEHEFYISKYSCTELGIDLKKDQVNPLCLFIVKSNMFQFYRFHPSHEIRVPIIISFVLGILSLALGLISIVITIFW